MAPKLQLVAVAQSECYSRRVRSCTFPRAQELLYHSQHGMLAGSQMEKSEVASGHVVQILCCDWLFRVQELQILIRTIIGHVTCPQPITAQYTGHVIQCVVTSSVTLPALSHVALPHCGRLANRQ